MDINAITASKLTASIMVRLDDDTKAKLETFCKGKKVAPSAVARELIKEFLSKGKR